MRPFYFSFTPLVVVFGAVGVAGHQPQVGWTRVQCVAVFVVDFPSVCGHPFTSHAPQHTLSRSLLFHSPALLGRGGVTAVHTQVLLAVVAGFTDVLGERDHVTLVAIIINVLVVGSFDASPVMLKLATLLKCVGARALEPSVLTKANPDHAVLEGKLNGTVPPEPATTVPTVTVTPATTIVLPVATPVLLKQIVEPIRAVDST